MFGLNFVVDSPWNSAAAEQSAHHHMAEQGAGPATAAAGIFRAMLPT
jgi:hypothetical protein